MDEKWNLIGAFHAKSTACSEVEVWSKHRVWGNSLGKREWNGCQMVLGTGSCRAFYALVRRLDWRWWPGLKCLLREFP